MSKSSVKEEVLGLVAIEKKRGEGDQDFLRRVIRGVDTLSDADYGKLSAGAIEWFNNAADSMEAKTDIADLPGAADKAEAPARGRKTATKEEVPEGAPVTIEVGDEVLAVTKRNKEVSGTVLEIDENILVIESSEAGVGEVEVDLVTAKSLEILKKGQGSADDSEGSAEPAVGDTVLLVTKRKGKAEGVVLEIDGDVVVLDVDGKEVEYERARVESIEVLEAAAAGDAPEGNEGDPAVGDSVVCVTARNKEVKGVVLEIDGDILVVDVEGKEVEVDMNTAKSVDIVEAEAPAPRRGAAKVAAKAAAAEPAEKEKKKKITSKDNDGVSVTSRMAEIICEDPTIKTDGIAKKLKAEKLVYNDASLQLVYSKTMKVIELLKKHKHYK